MAYKIDDFQFIFKGRELVQVVAECEVTIHKISREELISLACGEIKGGHYATLLWTDHDGGSERSTRVYFQPGAEELARTLDELVCFIHDRDDPIYQINIEDNLL